MDPTSFQLPLSNKKKTEAQEDMGVSFKALTTITCVAMIVSTLLLLCVGCNRGDYECTFESMPMVSHTMGIFPNDKIYVFLMNFFTAVNFVSYRHYYQKLAPIVTPQMNNVLLAAGYSTLITGPVLALFDHHCDDDHPCPKDDWGQQMHVNATAAFVVGQVIYLFGMSYIFNSNSQKF